MTSEWTEPAHDEPGTISGRWVVIGMFLFGMTATGSLWLYWYWHTAPFRPLQHTIAVTYKRSVPRVEGGRTRAADSPNILRIVMRVEFDPIAETDRSQQLAREVAQLARTHADLSTYDLLEFHFFWPKPEDEIQQQTVTIPVAEVIKSSAATP